ncbi:MAG: hypothetical protein AAF645_18045 [Myxococcota bacterium]
MKRHLLPWVLVVACGTSSDPADAGPADGALVDEAVAMDRSVGVDGSPGVDAAVDGAPMDLAVDESARDAALDAAVDADSFDVAIDVGDEGAPDMSLGRGCSAFGEALHCDDFEDESRERIAFPMRPEFERDEVFFGERSMRADVRGGQEFPWSGFRYRVDASRLFVRFYLHQSDFGGSQVAPIWLQGAFGTIIVNTGGPQMNFVVDGGRDGLTVGRSDVAVETGRWVCVQVEVEAGDGDAHLNVRFDGETAFDRSDLSFSELSSVSVGAISGRPTASRSMTNFIDELVIDDAPVPCE